MRTNIEIDDKLMKKAMKASGAPTKKAVVEEALQMLVRVKGQEGIWKWFGKVQFWDGYDHKAMRRDTSEDIVPVRTRLNQARRVGWAHDPQKEKPLDHCGFDDLGRHFSGPQQ